MAKLLIVETSPRGPSSISRGLTQRFVAAWTAAHIGGEVVFRDLAATELTFVTAPWLQAYFTPREQQTPEMKQALGLSDELVSEVLDADHLVIATPVYNYNVPAALKAWFDQIVRKGLTLGVDGTGLMRDKRATVLLASGGVYTQGSPIQDRDIATQYLQLILKVIGITDLTFIAAGNAKSVDLGSVGIDEFLREFDEQVHAASRL